MSSLPKALMSEAEYLANERQSQIKHEFYLGELFAMASAGREHNLIALNIGGELRQKFKGQRCEAYVGDMRVRVTRTGLYTYPDVVVVCDKPEFADDTLLNPTVLIEVLSDSTEQYDRGTKLKHYRQLPSLRGYVLVSQTEPLVEQCVRRDNNHWELSETAGLEATLTLSSLGCEIPLAEIFDKIVFPKPNT